jgi:uncharacterized FlgJ-related protein
MKVLLFVVLGIFSLALTTKAQTYEQIIYKELIRNNVDSTMAKIIVAIGKHESANFKSKLFTQNKNVFGMTYPPRRSTTATGYSTFSDNGNKRKFCKFSTTTASTTDFILYMRARKIPFDITSPESLVKLLKSKGYFEANELVYLRAVKKHLKELKL